MVSEWTIVSGWNKRVVVVFHHQETMEAFGHVNAAGGTKHSSITCVDVTSGSRFLAVGTDSDALNIWDMKSSNAVITFHVKGTVIAVAFQHTSD